MGIPFALAVLTTSVLVAGPAEPSRVPVRTIPGPELFSNGSSLQLLARETAGPDTFALYGGPDETFEGKFVGPGGNADWGGGNGLPGGIHGGGPSAWQPVDRTKFPIHWQVSTFNAANLNNRGAGNHAMWCGIDGSDPEALGWATAPGYGNGWDDKLVFQSPPVLNPAVGETVNLEFFLNWDMEPEFFDKLTVEYERDGVWVEVAAVTGTSAIPAGTFSPPGVVFTGIQSAPISYLGNDFGGFFGDQIVLRIRFRSDGAWSDQDGQWPTFAGAAQVDDITVQASTGTLVEDFEGPGPYLWMPDQPAFAGDFIDVYQSMSDIDPCRSNITPVIGFIDYGQVVRNGPGTTGSTSTGGSTAAGISYGISGNFVVNHSGGLSFGEVSLLNEVWSPEIQWDQPGVEDDGADVAGAFLRFSLWGHLPFENGIYYTWRVRSALAGELFGDWQDRTFVYGYPAAPAWLNQRHEITDLLQPQAERVQVALGCADYAELFNLPGNSGTPSPVFDNFAFYKYRIGGPAIYARSIDLAQDTFPVNGEISPDTQANRDALDIPFDMARDINQATLAIVPGDSIIVDVAAMIPGTTVTDLRMVWALSRNPVFEDAIRSAPARGEDVNVVAGAGIWSGEVLAQPSTTPSGTVLEGRWFFDLPDVDFLYPGDVLHYYIRATDDGGRVATLPTEVGDLANFGPGSRYSRTFTVRGLPSFSDPSGAHPDILVIDDYGLNGIEADYIASFAALGYAEGLDYDSFSVRGPSSLVSNGIGSAAAHGAEAGQIAGYSHIFYFAGNLSSGLISDGSDAGSNDKGNDIATLEQWQALVPAPGGSRNVVYFGDNIATALRSDSAESFGYLTLSMGVEWVDDQVLDTIGSQISPRVVPDPAVANGLVFTSDFIALGDCITTTRFDHITALEGAQAAHYFTDAEGTPVVGVGAGVASVLNPQTHGHHLTFPFSIRSIRDPMSRAVGQTARTVLFAEILDLFDAQPGSGPPVAAPAQRQARLDVRPNPFNPATRIEFTARPGSRGSIRIFNLRGELVRTLHDGEFQVSSFVWDGTDRSGSQVASGVYLVRATDGQVTSTQKVALVK